MHLILSVALSATLIYSSPLTFHFLLLLLCLLFSHLIRILFSPHAFYLLFPLALSSPLISTLFIFLISSCAFYFSL